jgi:RNA ligase
MLSIDAFLNHPYVFKSEWEDLVIFSYTRECQYDRAWDEVTRAARGIIFNKVTGELVARPFPKFFNLTEMPETSFGNLPDGPFSATVKMDGSMGIVYPYKGQYWVSTKGSLKSDQAKWATEWFRSNAGMSEIKKGWTPLFEIIYKENKIVVDYGDFEGMVLLAYIDNATGKEMSHEDLVKEGALLNVPVVRQETGFQKIEDLYEYCKNLPHTQEGFVVTFANGLKVKIKGTEYCRIHKMISRMTPLAYWEAWDFDLKDIPKSYMAQMPEEFRETSDALYRQIYAMHWDPYTRATQLHDDTAKVLGNGADKKTWALYVKEKYPEYFSYIMDIHNGSIDQVWVKIHRRIRPTQNVLPEGIAGADRLKRILQEN